MGNTNHIIIGLMGGVIFILILGIVVYFMVKKCKNRSSSQANDIAQRTRTGNQDRGRGGAESTFEENYYDELYEDEPQQALTQSNRSERERKPTEPRSGDIPSYYVYNMGNMEEAGV